MDINLTKQLAASILSQDQLVFNYLHKNDDGTTSIVVRYATPIELQNNDVLCIQHMPEEGFRRFKLNDITAFHRVITRSVNITADVLADADNCQQG